jgi:hypothetical protein
MDMTGDRTHMMAAVAREATVGSSMVLDTAIGTATIATDTRPCTVVLASLISVLSSLRNLSSIRFPF